MANNTVCTSCLRAIRQNQRIVQRTSSRSSRVSLSAHRSFTTSHYRLKEEEEKKKLFRPPPPPQQPYEAKGPSPEALKNFASSLRSSSSVFRSTTEPYIAYGGTEDLFLQCSRQCSYTIPSALETPPAPPPTNEAGDHLGQGIGWWLEPKEKGGLGLDATFNSWAQVLYLHMWMLTVRLRCFPAKYVKDWHQNLLDHFFYAAEDRMATWHGMSSRGVRNKNLKDLWLQWRGVQLGYDEGLVKGDAVMAAAIWRNVFKASENVDVADIAQVVAYMMRELRQLGELDDVTITEGRVSFGDPKTAKLALKQESALMRQTLTSDELKAPQKASEVSS
ncbi:CBP3, mitochondrial [Lecanosticta acicola]|uniref:CBP3, mitochondrial n=1 Tax=Lecanosticta acicola TaxID=111012 RepID=A0AAI8Z1Z1_9PEZI|nr:CBP3, mitochondrial [Lecanosticta acicola]